MFLSTVKGQSPARVVAASLLRNSASLLEYAVVAYNHKREQQVNSNYADWNAFRISLRLLHTQAMNLSQGRNANARALSTQVAQVFKELQDNAAKISALVKEVPLSSAAGQSAIQELMQQINEAFPVAQGNFDALLSCSDDSVPTLH